MNFNETKRRRKNELDTGDFKYEGVTDTDMDEDMLGNVETEVKTDTAGVTDNKTFMDGNGSIEPDVVTDIEVDTEGVDVDHGATDTDSDRERLGMVEAKVKTNTNVITDNETYMDSDKSINQKY